jgi:retron-type reverse transcriptase
VVDADIEACFDGLDQGILMNLIEQVIRDWFVLNLMRLWLKAGRKYRNQAVGVPMGAVLSPLWANIYLHQMDRALLQAGYSLVRYADDFLILAPDPRAARQAWLATTLALEPLKLRLSAPKTRLTSFEEGFQFLGVYFERDTYSYLWQEKTIKVKGKKLRMLYNHPPDFY